MAVDKVIGQLRYNFVNCYNIASRMLKLDEFKNTLHSR